MNTSDSPPDDSHWSSLAAELGLDSDPAPAAPQPQESAPPAPHAEHLPDATDDDDTMVEPHLSSEPVAEEAEGGDEPAEGEGEGGGKRRRRRRRRRRKGSGEGAETPAEGAAAEGSTADEGGDEEAAEDEPHAELPPRDAMADVIANWNVPSWDELIGGLYRPGN